MPPFDRVDFATAFARLLSDRRSRLRFREDPAELADQFGLVGSDRAAFLSLDPDDLDVQADGLISKRLREVAKRMPETWSRLGDDSSGRLFRMYASHNWPTGHRRHVDDALRFGRYLLDNGVPDVCRAELNQLQFNNSRQRLTKVSGPAT